MIVLWLYYDGAVTSDKYGMTMLRFVMILPDPIVNQYDSTLLKMNDYGTMKNLSGNITNKPWLETNEQLRMQKEQWWLITAEVQLTNNLLQLDRDNAQNVLGTA